MFNTNSNSEKIGLVEIWKKLNKAIKNIPIFQEKIDKLSWSNGIGLQNGSLFYFILLLFHLLGICKWLIQQTLYIEKVSIEIFEDDANVMALSEEGKN